MAPDMGMSIDIGIGIGMEYSHEVYGIKLYIKHVYSYEACEIEPYMEYTHDHEVYKIKLYIEYACSYKVCEIKPYSKLYIKYTYSYIDIKLNYIVSHIYRNSMAMKYVRLSYI